MCLELLREYLRVEIGGGGQKFDRVYEQKVWVAEKAVLFCVR
jgi:hypothetical protein